MHDGGRGRPVGQHPHQLALAHFFLAHVVGHPAHPRAGHRRVFEREQVVGHIARRVLHLLVHAARADQVPGGAPVGRRHGDAVELGQVVQRLGGALANQQLGAGHQDLRGVVQSLDDHAAAVVHRGAHAQRYVDALFHQVHRAVAHQHVDAHLGVLGQKPGHQLGHHGLRQCHRAAHADGAARRGLHLGHRVGRRLGGFTHGLAVAQIGFAHFGQRELAGGALQQAHAQLRLQVRHPARQARLGDAERAARSGKAAALHHFGEIQHVVEVLHGQVRNTSIVLWIEQSIASSLPYQQIDPSPQFIPWPHAVAPIHRTQGVPSCNCFTLTLPSPVINPCPAN